MKTKLGTGLVALCVLCVDSGRAGAADDDFGISETPAPKAAPVYNNRIEAGVGFSTEPNMAFGRYRGREGNGPFAIGNFSLLMRGQGPEDDAWFLRGTGERLGTESRLANLEAGKQGTLKLNFEFAGLSYNAFMGKSPFLGVGGDTLNLPAGWTKAASPAALNAASLATFKPVEISTTRERFRTGVNWAIDKEMSFRINGQHEEKRGLKQLGMDVNGFTAAMTVPEPINHSHDRLETEFAYIGKKFQWKLGYQMSLFGNAYESVTVSNPFTTATGNLLDRMALAPTNMAHSFNADGGFDVNDYTRLTVNLSESLYIQNEDFLPLTANIGQTIVTNTPRRSLEGEILNTVANVELASRPLPKFDVRAKYRYTSRDNRTPRGLFNYVTMDNENQTLGASSKNLRYNAPFSYEENLASVDFGYSLTPRTKVILGHEFRYFTRNFSERAHNYENTERLQVRTALADDLTGSVKYTHTVRDGTNYNPQGSLIWTNVPTLVTANGYDNNKLLRKYFEADVIRDNVQTSVTYSPTDALTLGGTAGVTLDNYNKTGLGLTDATSFNGTLDGSYALSEALSLNAFYTYEMRRTQQAGNATLVLGSYWRVNTNDDAHTIGMGLKWKATERTTLSSDYSYVQSVMAITNQTSPNIARGNGGFPEIITRTHTLSGKAEYELTDQQTLNFGYVYERSRSQDWQLDRTTVNSTVVMFMGPTSPNYDAHVVMMSLAHKF